MRFRQAVSQAFIPPKLWRNSHDVRDAQRVVALHLAVLGWDLVFAVLTAVLHAPTCSKVLLGGAPFLGGSLLLLRAGISPKACGNSLSFAIWAICTGLAVLSDGLNSPVMPWYCCIPVIATVLSGPISGIVWTLACMLAITGSVLAPLGGFALWNELTDFARHFLDYTALLAFLLFLSTIVAVFKKGENHLERVLEQANWRLELQASIDGLTGIHNRQTFDRIFEQEWKRHERSRLPLSVGLLDIDFFKHFNDANGHLEGDLCLMAVAQEIQSCLRRPGDFVARYGGEEFVVIFPDTNDQEAAWLFDDIRRQVKWLKILHPDSSVSSYVTISVGSSTTIPTRGESYLDFLQQVDLALYRAKANGRDQSVHDHAVPLELA